MAEDLSSKNATQEPSDEELVQLGGNIELSGFKTLDGGSMIILKKSYARKFSDSLTNFEKLSIRMKPIHETEGSAKFEIHGKLLDNGKVHTASLTDRNLFMVVDHVLKKLENSLN